MTRTTQVLSEMFALLHAHFGAQHWWPADTPFEVMVGAILTQNTAWRNVEKAIRNLKDADVLTPARLYDVPIDSLAALIRPSGFYNVKAKRLRAFLSHLKETYNFDLACMFTKELTLLRDELLRIRGVGKETADSILLYAGEKPTFVVDSYTTRILSRHGVCSEDDDYDTVQALFHDSLPCDVSLFNEYHAHIVSCAKEFCKTKPQCEQCPLRVLFDD